MILMVIMKFWAVKVRVSLMSNRYYLDTVVNPISRMLALNPGSYPRLPGNSNQLAQTEALSMTIH